MFDFLTNPIVNLFLAKFQPFPESKEFVFMYPGQQFSLMDHPALIITIALLITILTIFLLGIVKKERFQNFQKPMIIVSAVSLFIIAISLSYNKNITSEVNSKEFLSEKYFKKNQIDLAFSVNPNFKIKNQEEIDKIKKYIRKNDVQNPAVFKAMKKVYQTGLKDVAKDDTLVMVYDIQYTEALENLARKGYMPAIIELMPKMTSFSLKMVLSGVKKSCDNAEAAYATAKTLELDFKVRKKLGTVDVEKTKIDIERIEALRNWASFSKKECIPVWNANN